MLRDETEIRKKSSLKLSWNHLGVCAIFSTIIVFITCVRDSDVLGPTDEYRANTFWILER